MSDRAPSERERRAGGVAQPAAMKSAMNTLTARLIRGDRKAAARLISMIENEAAESLDMLREIFRFTGKAYRIGITGPPGVGKSTLVDVLTASLVKEEQSVGIIAVDPTSPFSGGALLGDRVRMSDIGMLEGVFIRSMATRGNLGGLAKTTSEAADVLDALGKDIILLETVGVGQSELDVVEAADTTIVVLMPESGDSVQAMKAGLMEIADLFVVNKADREGADHAVREIETVLEMVRKEHGWKVPVLKTVASEGRGIDELKGMIRSHHQFLKANGGLAARRRRRIRSAIAGIIQEKVMARVWNHPQMEIMLKGKIEAIAAGEGTPYSAAEELLEKAGLSNI